MVRFLVSLIAIAESSFAVLGRYLNHLAFLDKGISNEVRELARIGADVIAASMQYDQIARWALNGYGDSQHQPLPLGVFSMTRSSIYGLHYLDNMDNVKTSEILRSQGNYRRKMAKRWNATPFAELYGDLSTDRKDQVTKWNKMSEYVHIIPQIREHGGPKFTHRVEFTMPNQLSQPSHHAGLPEHFANEAEECLEWRAKIAIACLWRFREDWKQLFAFSSKKLQNHLEQVVWPECMNQIANIPVQDDSAILLQELANRIFAS